MIWQTEEIGMEISQIEANNCGEPTNDYSMLIDDTFLFKRTNHSRRKSRGFAISVILLEKYYIRYRYWCSATSWGNE